MKSRHAVKHLRSMTGRVGTWVCSNFAKLHSGVVAGLLLTGAGTVNTDELPSILTSLGYAATQEDVATQAHQVAQRLAGHLCLHQCLMLLLRAWPPYSIKLSGVLELQDDGEGSREVGLEDVLRLVENLKQLSAADTDDTDTVEAFVALGGKVSSTNKP